MLRPQDHGMRLPRQVDVSDVSASACQKPGIFQAWDCLSDIATRRHPASLTSMRTLEPVSSEFKPILCHQNTEIENLRPETVARNPPTKAENPKKLRERTA